MNYNELLETHQEEASLFSKDKIYFIFASNETEFINKLSEYGLNPDDVLSIGAGGYIKKEYIKEFNDLLVKQAEEKKKYTLNHIYEVVLYYCWDYELYISLSYNLKTLCSDIMDLTPEEIKANKGEINRAYKDYCIEFEKLNL